MDSMKEALMQRKIKGGTSITLVVGDQGDVRVEQVEKLDSEPPAPAGEPEEGDKEGMEGDEADVSGMGEDESEESPFEPMEERELDMLKAKGKPSLGERARMEAAMRSKK